MATPEDRARNILRQKCADIPLVELIAGEIRAAEKRGYEKAIADLQKSSAA